MRVVSLLLVLFLAGIVVAQDNVYVCPMDPDVRSSQPGFCPRCGMKLAAGLPEPAEYRMDLEVTPHLLRALQKVNLSFTVRDPWKGLPVKRFQSLHEKLFHVFVVSQDLQFFAHVHPALRPGGTFTYETALRMYRLLADFYPDGASQERNQGPHYAGKGRRVTPHCSNTFTKNGSRATAGSSPGLRIPSCSMRSEMQGPRKP